MTLVPVSLRMILLLFDHRVQSLELTSLQEPWPVPLLIPVAMDGSLDGEELVVSTISCFMSMNLTSGKHLST